VSKRVPTKKSRLSPEASAALQLLKEGSSTLPGLHVTFLGRNKKDLRELALTDAAAQWDFSTTIPVRAFPSYRGQGNFPGSYWSSTTGTFLEYESRLERSDQMLVDFDPLSVAIATQPFYLHGFAGGEPWHHCPDTFVAYSDGRKEVRDVKPLRELDEYEEQFSRTRSACEQVGWGYHVASEPDEVLLANVSWFAGYRRHIVDEGNFAAALLEMCEEPLSLDEAVWEVGDPLLVRPIAYQLLWQQRLQMRMDRVVSGRDLVGLAGWLS